MAIVKEMLKGKHVKTPIGEIGMGEDMSIGFVMYHESGAITIGGLSTMDLAQLNRLLNDYNIGLVIPE
jgi:hypothetical protein